MATPDEAVAYYVDRLIAQYRDQPKARATIALVGKEILADNLASQLGDAYDLELAVGPQLDVIGKYVGLSRLIGASQTPPLFSFWNVLSPLVPSKYQGTWDPVTNTPTIPAASGGNTGNWYVVYGSGHSTGPVVNDWLTGDIIVSDGTTWNKNTADNGNGLTDVTNSAINANGVFYDAQSAQRQVSALSDPSYRAVIKLKIVQNSINGTLAAILDYLQNFFPSLIFVQDNQDMTLNYLVLSTVPVSLALLKLYLPKPMGVGINVFIINPTPSGGGRLETEPGGDILTTEDGSGLGLEP